MDKFQHSEAEKIELLQNLIDNITENNHDIEFVISTFHNFYKLNKPIQQLVEALGKEKQFYCITRFKKSGRIRVFNDFEETYYTLLGMCTLLSEINGNDPLIAIKDNLLI